MKIQSSRKLEFQFFIEISIFPKIEISMFFYIDFFTFWTKKGSKSEVGFGTFLHTFLILFSTVLKSRSGWIFGMIWGAFGGQIGTILGSNWDHSGIKFDTKRYGSY